MDATVVAAVVIAFIVGSLIGCALYMVVAHQRIRSASATAQKLLLEAQAKEKEILLEAKDEAIRLRNAAEAENRERRADLQRQEKRLLQKEENLDRRSESLDRRERQLGQKEQKLDARREEVEALRQQQVAALERIAELSHDEARTMLISQLELELKADIERRVRDMEAQIKAEADMRAQKIVGMAIQRCAADVVAETTVSVVNLPNEDMKGRIIGKEGRNIRALEQATGVDLIIDDTPETVVLSGFDPVRREVARIALTKLILDGRIHPARIEDVVAKARQEVDSIIREAGENAALEANVHGLQPELLKILGRLHFRTSYGQNVLAHSVEVSILAATIAHELGADVNVCKIAALLHDLGKAIDQEVEGPHAIISGEIARRFGRSPKIIHAMVAHHASDTEPQTLEAAIVQAADAISAARPGARRETIDLYIKRLEALEHIANSFTGVEKSFAIQAGREVRIIVKPEEIDEYSASLLASEIAHKIE